jgi:hypothetical protein
MMPSQSYAEKFKESVVQQSIGHLPLTPILNKMQDIQKVSAEKIQSDTGALVHSDIKEGGELEDKLKQEISEALSTRENLSVTSMFFEFLPFPMAILLSLLFLIDP